MKAFAAWVNECKKSYVGGRGHTRGAAAEVEGHDEGEEDKEQPKDGPKDKDRGKHKLTDEPEEKGKDQDERKDKDRDKAQTTRHGHRSPSPRISEQPQQTGDVRAMGDEVVQRCKECLTQHMSVPMRDCVPSVVAKAMSDASKSQADTLIGRLTNQPETERMGRANAEA